MVSIRTCLRRPQQQHQHHSNTFFDVLASRPFLLSGITFVWLVSMVAEVHSLPFLSRDHLFANSARVVVTNLHSHPTTNVSRSQPRRLPTWPSSLNEDISFRRSQPVKPSHSNGKIEAKTLNRPITSRVRTSLLFSQFMAPLKTDNSHRWSRIEDPCSDDDSGYRSRVCQNCAKITRAPTAIEECCSNRHNAFNWCRRLYDFHNALG